MISISQFVVIDNQSLREALKVIDINAHGIAFVVNDKGKLIGVLTDGDIRRGLLNNATPETPVLDLMKKNFVSLPVTAVSSQIQKTLSDKIRFIPLVDEKGIPVDYASVSKHHKISICKPSLSGNELQYVSECINSGWISSQGAFVKRFESDFAKYCQSEYALAVSNGTVALHLALAALDIGPGDEVIVPDLTFAASINAVIYTGAIPVVVDVDRVTWTLSVDDVKRKITSKTKAIMPVHLYGHPCHMDELFAIAHTHNLFIVEDCAEAIGSLYKGSHVGNKADAAAFSFFGNITITTGEGGMILFKDKKVFEKAAVLRDHGMSKEKRYWHDHVGFNYRMTNMQAAIGCAQMERINQFVEKKRLLAKQYNSILKESGFFELPPEETWALNCFWIYTCLVKDNALFTRDELIQKLLKNGIETRPVFYTLHQIPPYKQYVSNQKFDTSQFISDTGISFPSSVDIDQLEIDNIANAISRVVEQTRAVKQ